jgi:hypothetical protein
MSGDNAVGNKKRGHGKSGRPADKIFQFGKKSRALIIKAAGALEHLALETWFADLRTIISASW